MTLSFLLRQTSLIYIQNNNVHCTSVHQMDQHNQTNGEGILGQSFECGILGSASEKEIFKKQIFRPDFSRVPPRPDFSRVLSEIFLGQLLPGFFQGASLKKAEFHICKSEKNQVSALEKSGRGGTLEKSGCTL